MLPITLFAAGLFVFKESTPNDCEMIRTDAHIFVLTGDARRIPFAIEKLADYPRRRLYIIGAGTPTLDTKFQSQIEIESESKTTYENAVAIKYIARRKLLTRIVIITTIDHVNRAMFLVKKQIPYAKISACPVPLTKMPAPKRLERWVEEYVKFLGSLIGLTSRGN